MLALIIIVAFVSHVILSTTLIPKPEPVPNSSALIDFEMFDRMQAPFKGIDERELMSAFGLYIEAAGFEETMEKYTEKVHGVIEKRLQDALILK